MYKGVLSNGQHVAIKHIVGEAYLETFVREVTSLSHVRHQNLVSLVGYCDDEGECFLVYELCQEGNLSDWLFGILFYPHIFIEILPSSNLFFHVNSPIHSYSMGENSSISCYSFDSL